MCDGGGAYVLEEHVGFISRRRSITVVDNILNQVLTLLRLWNRSSLSLEPVTVMVTSRQVSPTGATSYSSPSPQLFLS